MSGGPGRRSLAYVVQRHLHLGWPEWQQIPWHRQRALLEGLEQEGIITKGPAPNVTTNAAGVTTEVIDMTSVPDAEMREAGMSVVSLDEYRERGHG